MHGTTLLQMNEEELLVKIRQVVAATLAECALPRKGFTPVETAKILGISRASLDRLAKRGLIHPCRALRLPVYSIEEINRFLRETTDEVATEGEP